MPRSIEARRAWQREHAAELAAASAAWRAANPERQREIAIKSYRKNREKHRERDKVRWQKYKIRIKEADRSRHLCHPELGLFYGAKARAKKLNLSFTIEKKDIVMPEFCPVLGIRLCPAIGRQRQNSPTLDRINNSLGYEKGNVIVVSWRANQLKSDASLEEMQVMASFYRRYM